jgi:hypothetical protein
VEYIDNFWKIVDWKSVMARYREAIVLGVFVVFMFKKKSICDCPYERETRTAFVERGAFFGRVLLCCLAVSFPLVLLAGCLLAG